VHGRTLAGRVLEDLQKLYGDEPPAPPAAATAAAAAAPGGGPTDAADQDAMQQAIGDLENINAHLFSIEALMERIFDVRVPEEGEQKFRELAGCRSGRALPMP